MACDQNALVSVCGCCTLRIDVIQCLLFTLFNILPRVEWDSFQLYPHVTLTSYCARICRGCGIGVDLRLVEVDVTPLRRMQMMIIPTVIDRKKAK